MKGCGKIGVLDVGVWRCGGVRMWDCGVFGGLGVWQ